MTVRNRKFTFSHYVYSHEDGYEGLIVNVDADIYPWKPMEDFLYCVDDKEKGSKWIKQSKLSLQNRFSRSISKTFIKYYEQV